MKMKSFFLVVAASLLGWSLGNASVTGVTEWGYSGGVYCYQPILTNDNTTMMIDGYQSGQGEMSGTITTSSPLDPILTIANSIDNDSTFIWTEYIVKVSLNTNFTILSAAANPPPGWTANITQPGTPVGGIYTGTIDYLAGTPVAIGPGPNSGLDFSYQIQFFGLTQYSLTESVTPVPEPGTLGLLTVGGLLMGGRAFSKRR